MRRTLRQGGSEVNQKRTFNPSFLLLMVVMLLCATYLWQTGDHQEKLEYSEVVQLFQQEKVESFTVSDTTLTMVYATASLPLSLSIPLVIVLTILLGVLVEKVAYRPLRSAPRMSVMISAIGMFGTGAELLANEKVKEAYLGKHKN